MKTSIPVIAAALAVLASSAVIAGTVPVPTATTTGANSKTSTKAYVGLNWTVGGGLTPAMVLGVSNAKVKANGDTEGAKLEFHANLAGGLKPGKIKLGYLNGQEDAQGEIGLGYDFVRSAPLGYLGLNASHVSIGLDGYLNPGFVPYATVHSLDKFKKPGGSTTTLSCPSGFILSGSSCVVAATTATSAAAN